jgi:CheY-like chemotaxis protein/anti-sigma regulatory factor (Ser/Thr protein kinase)
MESLGTLAGGVAHDMNNVLGAILGLASAHIGNQPSGSPLHQAFDIICKATERGGKMVKSLLSFARQSPAESTRVDMNAVLKEEVGLLERTTLAKVRLKMDLEAELRPIHGDASALTHAFMNLCVNAVDAMPEKGTLTLHTRNIDNDWIEVVVEDTGIGMPKEVLEKAVEPFFTTKGTGKGTGLGLSLVFSTVKAHRGQMAIESEPGQGTRVMLRFPACQLEAPVQTAPPATVDATLPAHGSLKVLLVDDDDLIQSSVRMILEVLGHSTVTTAPSGEEALTLLEAGLEADLVILDMNMPGLGGIGTLPRLRALRPQVPVLLSTGRVDQKALNLASIHPGVSMLSKPFRLEELQKHLESIGLR